MSDFEKNSKFKPWMAHITHIFSCNVSRSKQVLRSFHFSGNVCRQDVEYTLVYCFYQYKTGA